LLAAEVVVEAGLADPTDLADLEAGLHPHEELIPLPVVADRRPRNRDADVVIADLKAEPEDVDAKVAARVDQVEGIVPDVGVAVETLGIGRVLDKGIGLEETAEGGIVGAGGKEDEAMRRILPLARELMRDVRRPFAPVPSVITLELPR
jgi:hypothetical protein